MPPRYRALFSSDWNECLAPCGPFDAIVFRHPSLASAIEPIFRAYTGNRIPLSEAADRIRRMLPQILSAEEMDVYLTRCFRVYPGVADLITWCRRHDVLFMINTTGMIGCFQRIFTAALLPEIPVLAAHPMIRFSPNPTDPVLIHELTEIGDKGRFTEAVARSFAIPFDRVLVMGDSGGDGPHFEWAMQSGAVRIGSMVKASLAAYCETAGVAMDHIIGPRYAPGEPTDRDREMRTDFTSLIPVIQSVLEK